MENKKLDWAAAYVLNPTADYDFWKEEGFNSSNTYLLPADEYKSNEKVQKYFLNEEGVFDENKFDETYKTLVATYNTFVTNQDENKRMRLYIGTYANPFAEVKYGPTLRVRSIENPTDQSYNLIGEGKLSTPVFSMREIGQTQLIKDPDTGKDLDYTPNSFWRSIFGKQSVVEARWESDGTHINTFGQTVAHRKGDWKLNENGKPYYELLNGRDTSDKNFLKWEDVLTKDGSWWNQLDFMDSDSVTKSIGGQTVKTALTIASLFIPYVGTGIIALGILKGLGEITGALGKAFTEADFNNDGVSESWKTFNSLSAITNRFGSSTSDESSGRMWGYENVTNMVGDIVGMLKGQIGVAKAVPKIGKMFTRNEIDVVEQFVKKNGNLKIKKFNNRTLDDLISKGDLKKTVDSLKPYIDQKEFQKLAETTFKLTKAGREVGSTYMALSQVPEVYEGLKENGFDSKTVLGGTLTAAIGFYGIMKTPLGRWVYDKSDDLIGAGKAIRKFQDPFIKRVATDLSLAGPTASDKITKNIIAKGYKKMISEANKIFKAGNDYSVKSYLNNMLSEAGEELSEEFLQDLIMTGASQLEESLSSVGFKTKHTYKYSESNPLQRYIMSTFGGALGGGIFKGMTHLENWKSITNAAIQENIPETDYTQLVKSISDYGYAKVEKEINKFFNSKPFSDVLGMEVDEEASLLLDPNGNKKAYKPVEDVKASQNEILRTQTLEYAKAIDSFIKSEKVGMTKEQLFESSIYKQFRLGQLLTSKESENIYDGYIKEVAKLGSAIIKLKGVKDGDDELKSELKFEIDLRKEKIKDIIEGKNIPEYIERISFVNNTNLSGPFQQLSIEMFAKSAYNLDYNNLSELEKKVIHKEHEKYLNSSDLENNFRIFKTIKDNFQNPISKLRDSNLIEPFKNLQKLINEAQLTEEEIKEYIEALKSKDENGQLIPLSNDEIIEKYGINIDGYTSEEEIENKINESLRNLVINNSLRLLTVNDRKNELRKLNIKKGSNILFNSLKQANIDKIFEQLSKFASTQRLDSFTIQALKDYIAAAGKIDISKLINSVESKNLDQDDNLLNGLVKKVLEGNKEAIDDLVNLLEILTNDIPLLTWSDSVYNILGETFDDFTDNIKVNSSQESSSWQTHEIKPENVEYRLVADGSNLKYEQIVYITPIGNENFNNVIDLTVNNKVELPDDKTSFTFKMNLGQIDISKIEPTLFIKLRNIDNVTDLINDPIGEILLKHNTAFVETYNKVLELNKLTQIESDPIYDALSELSQMLYGDDLFKILAEENIKYSNNNRLDDYVINDILHRDVLEKMATTIQILSSIMSETSSDSLYMDSIQSYREANGLVKYTEFTPEEMEVVNGMLNSINAQITYLINLSKHNDSSKFDINKKTIEKERELLWKYLTFEDGNRSTKLNQIIELGNTHNIQSINLDDLSDETASSDLKIANYNNKLSLLEGYIYDIYNSLKDDEKSKFYDILDVKELSSFEKLDTLDKNTAVISDVYFAKWILQAASYDQRKLNKEYVSLVSNPNLKVPFYVQELAIKQSISFVRNPSVINDYFNYLSINHNNDEDDNKKMERLVKNFIFINGSAGSGKTTVIGDYIYKLLKSEVDKNELWIVSNNENSLKNFTSVLQSKDDINFVKSKMFAEILSEYGMQEYAKYLSNINAPRSKHNGELHDNSKSDLYANWFKKDKLPSIILYDEATHLTHFERDLLSYSGIKVIGLGDLKQEGIVNDSEKSIDINNNGQLLFTTDLNLSIRADNVFKKQSLDKIVLNFNDIDLEHSRRVKGEPTVLNLNNIYSSLQKESFKYYEKNGELLGEKTIDPNDLEKEENVIWNILNKGESIVYISRESDPQSKKREEWIKTTFKGVVPILDIKSIQGYEYDYIISDVNFTDYSKFNIDNRYESFYNDYRKFYTLLSRSKKGSILLNRNLIIPNSIQSTVKPVDISLTDDSVKNYREFLLNVLYKDITPIPPSKKVDLETSDGVDTDYDAVILDREKYEKGLNEKIGKLQDNVNSINIIEDWKNNNDGKTKLTSLYLSTDIVKIITSLFKNDEGRFDEEKFIKWIDENPNKWKSELYKKLKHTERVEVTGLENNNEANNLLLNYVLFNKIDERNFNDFLYWNDGLKNIINDTYSNFNFAEFEKSIIFVVDNDGEISLQFKQNSNTTVIPFGVAKHLPNGTYNYSDIKIGPAKFTNKGENKNYNIKIESKEIGEKITLSNSLYAGKRPNRNKQNTSFIMGFGSFNKWIKRDQLQQIFNKKDEESLSVFQIFTNPRGPKFSDVMNQWTILNENNEKLNAYDNLIGNNQSFRLLKGLYSTSFIKMAEKFEEGSKEYKELEKLEEQKNLILNYIYDDFHRGNNTSESLKRLDSLVENKKKPVSSILDDWFINGSFNHANTNFKNSHTFGVISGIVTLLLKNQKIKKEEVRIILMDLENGVEVKLKDEWFDTTDENDKANLTSLQELLENLSKENHTPDLKKDVIESYLKGIDLYLEGDVNIITRVEQYLDADVVFHFSSHLYVMNLLNKLSRKGITDTVSSEEVNKVFNIITNPDRESIDQEFGGPPLNKNGSPMTMFKDGIWANYVNIAEDRNTRKEVDKTIYYNSQRDWNTVYLDSDIKHPDVFITIREDGETIQPETKDGSDQHGLEIPPIDKIRSIKFDRNDLQKYLDELDKIEVTPEVTPEDIENINDELFKTSIYVDDNKKVHYIKYNGKGFVITSDDNIELGLAADNNYYIKINKDLNNGYDITKDEDSGKYHIQILNPDSDSDLDPNLNSKIESIKKLSIWQTVNDGFLDQSNKDQFNKDQFNEATNYYLGQYIIDTTNGIDGTYNIDKIVEIILNSNVNGKIKESFGKQKTLESLKKKIDEQINGYKIC